MSAEMEEDKKKTHSCNIYNQKIKTRILNIIIVMDSFID